jgi:hypothetical protein
MYSKPQHYAEVSARLVPQLFYFRGIPLLAVTEQEFRWVSRGTLGFLEERRIPFLSLEWDPDSYIVHS